jgi:nitrogenase molybdenum-iron protein alpha/beta subunit
MSSIPRKILDKTDQDFIQVLIVYTIEATNLSEKNIAKAIKDMPQPITKSVMTAYESIMRKGIEKGRKETQVQMILAPYDDGIDIQQIARYVKISEEKTLKILRENGRVD